MVPDFMGTTDLVGLGSTEGEERSGLDEGLAEEEIAETLWVLMACQVSSENGVEYASRTAP